jgi:hypothetical protein
MHLFKKEKEINIYTDNLDIWELAVIVVDLNKNFIFLDAKGSQALIFDHDANFLKIIARKGEGPGELKFPISVTIDNNGDILILDLPQKRINRFSKDKGFISSFLISRPPAQGVSIKVDSKGFILMTGFRRLDYRKLEFGMWISKYDSKGKYLGSFFPSSKYNKNWVWRIGPFCIFDIDKEDIIYAIQHCDYKISKYNPEGKLLNTFGKTPYYFRYPKVEQKIDFKNISRFELISKFEKLSSSWTKIIDLMIVKNTYLLLFIEINNLIKGFNKKYVIDIWDKEGNFVAGGIQTDYRLLCRDKEDNLYFLINKDEQKYSIGKYHLTLD